MSGASENFSVREADSLRPRLREGLRFSLREERHGPICLVEDTTTGRFHRIGITEYRFLRALDGSRTVASLLAELARAGTGDALTEHEAMQVIGWARDQHLLEIVSARAKSKREGEERAMRAAATWLNPLTVRIPLGRPDRFFAAIAPRLRWALGKGGALFWAIVVFVGAMHIGTEWPRFQRGFDGILASDNWLWLFLAFAGLKVAHEFAHGLWCRHFGAPVREVGIIFMLGVPMGYIDATAAIGIESKWRRIMVSCAGLWMEFFIAAIAAIVWSNAGPGRLETFAHNVVVTGTVVTLFFNANPLMRFDGYFILADLVEVPNLAARGRQWVQRALIWLLLGGERSRPAALKSREDWIVAVHGVASWIWQGFVLASLLAAASTMLRGGGIVLAILAVGGWIAVPVWRLGKTIATNVHAGAGSLPRVLLRLGVVAAIVIGGMSVPFHRTVSAPAVIEFADTQVLRAECPGFISEIAVRDGAEVAKDQLLVRLKNSEAENALARARLSLQQQELKARLAYTRQDVASFQAEEAKVAALRETVAQHEAYVATMEIRAPAAGRVACRKIEELRGAFIRAGEEVLRFGMAQESDARIAVSQDQEPHFRSAVTHPVRVKIAGRGETLHGTLTRVEARAGREVALPALTALAGGPLLVRRADHEADDSSQQPNFELVEPHFLATVRLENGGALLPGEMARVKFASGRRVTAWSELQRTFVQWWKRAATKRGGEEA